MRYRILILALLLCSCTVIMNDRPEKDTPVKDTPEGIDFSLKGLARMFADLPLEQEHLREVYDAVGSSSGNGYDEEYTIDAIISNPGAGVGDTPGSKAGCGYGNPLRNLIQGYLQGKVEASGLATKAGESTEELTRSLMERLSDSGYQLYWPYSEDWDGKSFPIITFDPGYGAESNYGYEVSYDGKGYKVVDSVYVDEAVAKRRPVWVLNNNTDSGFTPLELFAPGGALRGPEAASRPRKLLMKSFTMLRNYDSWFGGASEFVIKMGSVDGFNASTEAELKLYTPSVTDFIIVVKRKYVGKELPFEALLVSDVTPQLDKLAFLVTEDDGGTRTTWKCDIAVKIQSKAYGITVDIPFNEKDDIVWRGRLSRSFFEEEDVVTARFGDVNISFELD